MLGRRYSLLVHGIRGRLASWVAGVVPADGVSTEPLAELASFAFDDCGRVYIAFVDAEFDNRVRLVRQIRPAADQACLD